VASDNTFPVSAAMESNPKYLRCSLLARHLFKAMITHTDAEGRALADPLTWQQEAALWGPAHQDPAAIESALGELYREGLAVTYDAGRMLLLPGRFEHNPGREYWAKSSHRLPPMELLLEVPEYLDGLRRIDSRGKLLRTKYPDAPRYPALGPAGPDGGTGLRVLDGDKPATRATWETLGQPGTNRETPDGGGVGVGVGVGVGDKTRRGPRVRVAPSPSQLRMLEDMATERGRDIEAEAGAAGCPWPLRVADVTTMRLHLKALVPMTEKQAEDQERRAAMDAAWAELDPGANGHELVAELLATHRERDERRAWGLLQRLGDWLDAVAGFNLTNGSLEWSDLDRLPDLWRSAGLDNTTKKGAKAC
jgi:hypothetical protein